MTHRLIVKGELLLYGVVGGGGMLMPDGFTDAEVARALAEMKGNITVRINSPGGIARQGVAIYNLLRDYKSKVTVKVDGVAASAASIIAMAGAEIVVPKSATVMIHNASGVTLGTAEDHIKMADALSKLDGQMAGIYARRSGMKRDAIKVMMDEETWMDGAEALESGFADVAPDADDDEPEAIAFDYSIYAHAPERLLRKSQRISPDLGEKIAASAAPLPTMETAMAEASKTVAEKPAEQKVVFASVADLTAAYPEFTATLRAEGVKEGAEQGAKAERERITKIEQLGAQMKGHEKLLADMKADGTTPEQAAMKLIAAENALRESQLKGVKAVEDHTGKVAAAAAPAAEPPKSSASTPEGWATEYEAQTPAGAELRSEFSTKEQYVAFKKAEASGKLRILGRRTVA